MLFHMAELPPFSRINNIPLNVGVCVVYVCVTFSSSIH